MNLNYRCILFQPLQADEMNPVDLQHPPHSCVVAVRDSGLRWLSTRDNFTSESLRDLISCTRVLWHRLNASWTWVFFSLAAAECGLGKTKASSAGCLCCCICLSLDGRSVRLLLFGRLFCTLLWSFHASCSETSLQRWFLTSEIGFWQRRWICDISVRIYEILFSAAANSFVV